MTAAAGGRHGPPSDRAPEPLRRFRGPALSGPGDGRPLLRLALASRCREARANRNHSASACAFPASAASSAASVTFAAASMAASDFRTWLRSVVYQKSGSDAFR